jgi:hypothetical protein
MHQPGSRPACLQTLEKTPHLGAMDLIQPVMIIQAWKAWMRAMEERKTGLKRLDWTLCV